MSFLDGIRPTKQAKKFEIKAYSEDMEVFLETLIFLEKKNKSGGSFTQESLFEHLIAPLRENSQLKSSKRKARGTTV